MPTFSHLYGSYSVESTINLFLKDNLGTSAPSWMTWQTVSPRTLVFDYPDAPLSTPCFAVAHRGSEPGLLSQGDHVGGTGLGQAQRGAMEINCWVTTKGNNSWMRQLRDMRDMVYKTVFSNRTIQMQSFADPTSASALAAVVHFTRLRETPVTLGHNPSLQRKQIVIGYSWLERF